MIEPKRINNKRYYTTNKTQSEIYEVLQRKTNEGL